MRKKLIRFSSIFSISLGCLLASLFSAPAVQAAIGYNNGEYTNLCGSGLAATSHACSNQCNPTTGTCSASSNTVIKFTCNGKLNECKENETAAQTSQSIGSVGCDKTVAIVAYTKNCRANGGWNCAESDTRDYMVWYSGSCNGNTGSASQASNQGQGNNPPNTTNNGGSCTSQQPVLIQFRTPNGGWSNGAAISNNRLRTGQTIDVNCFAKSGTALLEGGYIEATDPAGNTTRVSNTSELRGYMIPAVGNYSFACKSATIASCTNLDSFTILGVVNPPLPQPTYTALPTPTATPIEQRSSCDSLNLISGNDSLVPAKVTLRASGSDNKGSIQRYRFYFGDGEQQETDNPEVTHEYKVSGSFTARVDVRDSVGNWKSSGSCERNVSVRSSSLESFKSGCSDMFVTANNSGRAPSKVTFDLTGFDNKGSIQAYRVDFGNGIIRESTDRHFEQIYDTVGSYQVRGYIKDSQGNWVGGENSCSRKFSIGSTKALTTQPSTGTPETLTLASIISGGVGASLQVMKRRGKLG